MNNINGSSSRTGDRVDIPRRRRLVFFQENTISFLNHESKARFKEMEQLAELPSCVNFL